MAYSKYAMRKEVGMTFGEVVVLMALGALLLAAAASAFRIPPVSIFVAACVPSALVLALAQRELDARCGYATVAGVAGSILVTAAVLALTLWAAAAVAGVIKGVRLAKAGSHEAGVARLLGCPLAGALGGGIVFFALLAAALHCMN
jgi:hypothetical protein